MDPLRMVSHFLHSGLVKLLHSLDTGKLFGALNAVMQVVEYQFMQFICQSAGFSVLVLLERSQLAVTCLILCNLDDQTMACK